MGGSHLDKTWEAPLRTVCEAVAVAKSKHSIPTDDSYRAELAVSQDLGHFGPARIISWAMGQSRGCCLAGQTLHELDLKARKKLYIDRLALKQDSAQIVQLAKEAYGTLGNLVFKGGACNLYYTLSMLRGFLCVYV